MLTVHHLHKSYGVQPVLHDVSFNLGDGERLGLIGPNGCGKTALLRILAGLEPPDSGTVTTMRSNPSTGPGQRPRIGYLAQGMVFDPGQTVRSALGPAAVKAEDLEGEVAALAAALSLNPNDSALQARYDSALAWLSSPPPPLSTTLGPLGLDGIPPETPISHLSGGQKTRLMLARLVLEEPQLLLLDEPTNHLDIEMLEWLEGWLGSFDGSALVVSHDRAFLDNTVTSILDLDPVTHTVRAYKGNYSAYLEQYLGQQQRQLAAYRDQEAEVRRMQQDIQRTKQQSLRVELATTPRQPGVRRIAKKVAKKALSREKKLERYLESGERLEKPRPSWQMKLEFEPGEHQGRKVLSTEDLAVGYDKERPLLRDINLHILGGTHIALTGPNGAGKTALLRTLAGRLEPLGGTLRFGASVKPGYMAQEQELLDPALSALQTVQNATPLNETEARNFLHYFLFEDDDTLRPARDLSFGERARLQLGLLVAQGCTFLLLDEPINHLDIPSRARFEQALANFKGTVLAVVHDRYFIEAFASEVWTLRDGTIRGGL
jgi:ATP-binding cassette, subfamily F, member 3